MARKFVVFALIFVAAVAGSVSAQEPSPAPKAALSPESSSSPAATPVAVTTSAPKTSPVAAPVASAPKASSPVTATPEASAATPEVSTTPASSPDVDISSPPAPGSEYIEADGPMGYADQPTGASPVEAPTSTPASAASGLEIYASVSVAAVALFFLF